MEYVFSLPSALAQVRLWLCKMKAKILNDNLLNYQGYFEIFFSKVTIAIHEIQKLNRLFKSNEQKSQPFIVWDARKLKPISFLHRNEIASSFLVNATIDFATFDSRK